MAIEALKFFRSLLAISKPINCLDAVSPKSQFDAVPEIPIAFDTDGIGQREVVFKRAKLTGNYVFSVEGILRVFTPSTIKNVPHGQSLAR